MPPSPTLTCAHLSTLLFAGFLGLLGLSVAQPPARRTIRCIAHSSLPSQGLSRACLSAANFVDCFCHARRPLSPRQVIG
ncbi:hypothetical protein P171DRAFT_200915 [Karstenula rhodostoma CBS 690.94]|uniref:Extracellular membrane protein CFEM domain-containing protein n=1 Tax=Karstenula rhodostoma CBS 690.94 TaxID=1392251 RepID=A0A9P4UI27_9PLEO|nr:hypothetical protein P171DRAFT_200915 [Karstenula rhodostoma CBS 690.94]